MNLVYVCSPYRGDSKKAVKKNVKRARKYCRLVAQQGGIPFAPHLLFTQFLDDANPRNRRMGLRLGLAMLKRCDELWVFGKPSEGMASEIAYAMKLGLPVRWHDSEGGAKNSE